MINLPLTSPCTKPKAHSTSHPSVLAWKPWQSTFNYTSNWLWKKFIAGAWLNGVIGVGADGKGGKKSWFGGICDPPPCKKNIERGAERVFRRHGWSSAWDPKNNSPILCAVTPAFWFMGETPFLRPMWSISWAQGTWQWLEREVWEAPHSGPSSACRGPIRRPISSPAARQPELECHS